MEKVKPYVYLSIPYNSNCVSLQCQLKQLNILDYDEAEINRLQRAAEALMPLRGGFLTRIEADRVRCRIQRALRKILREHPVIFPGKG